MKDQRIIKTLYMRYLGINKMLEIWNFSESKLPRRYDFKILKIIFL